MKLDQPGFVHVGDTGFVAQGHICDNLIGSAFNRLGEFFFKRIQNKLTKNESSRRLATGRIFYIIGIGICALGNLQHLNIFHSGYIPERFTNIIDIVANGHFAMLSNWIALCKRLDHDRQ